MISSFTLAIKSVDTSSFQAKAAVVFTAIGLSLPILLHLFPSTVGVPMGPKLLPLFYAPFIAVLFFRFPVALLVALLAPFANWAIFGKPGLELVVQLAFELCLFVFLAHLLKDLRGMRWMNASFSFILAKILFWGAATLLLSLNLMESSPVHFTHTVEFAAPGIFILLGLNIIMLSFKNLQGNESKS